MGFKNGINSNLIAYSETNEQLNRHGELFLISVERFLFAKSRKVYYMVIEY